MTFRSREAITIWVVQPHEVIIVLHFTSVAAAAAAAAAAATIHGTWPILQIANRSVVLCCVVRPFVRYDHHRLSRRQTQGGHVTGSTCLYLYRSHTRERKEKKKTAQRCMQQTRNYSKSNNSKRIVVGFCFDFGF